MHKTFHARNVIPRKLSLDNQRSRQRGGEKKRKSKYEVENELIKSLVEGEVVENEELNERTKNVTNYEEAIPVVKEYKNIVNVKKKGILNLAYREGMIFKIFKEIFFVDMTKEI